MGTTTVIYYVYFTIYFYVLIGNKYTNSRNIKDTDFAYYLS